MLITTAAVFLALGIFIARLLIPDSGDAHAFGECSGEEEFMPFLQHFHSDVVFQKGRTKFPLQYTTLHQQHDSLRETFLIERAEWIPLVIFGTEGSVVVISPGADPCAMSVTLQGVHSGEYARFAFIREEGRWWLQSFEDYSD